VKIRFRPRTRTDLRTIFNDTYDRWGSAQADLYIKQLRFSIDSLKENPRRGYKYTALNYYRSIHSGRHLIFYTIDTEYIVIVRVLHDRMDIEPNLLDD